MRLSDSDQTTEQTLERIMSAEHDPSGSRWRDSRGNPTKTHPVAARAMRSLLNKAEKERSSCRSLKSRDRCLCQTRRSPRCQRGFDLRQRGRPAIRATKLQYYNEPFFNRREAISATVEK
jgi:hypothetical protein